MSQPEARSYAVASAPELREVTTALSERLRVRPAGAHRVDRRFYDTFDWRLHGAGWTLSREGARYRLSNHETGVTWRVGAEGEWRWWRDAPEGAVRALLRDLTGVRALIEMGQVRASESELRVLNDDDKTVVRLRVVAPGSQNAPGGSIRVQPVRGYDGAARRVGAVLEELGLAAIERDELSLAAEARGRYPGDYSSRLDVELPADATLYSAAVTLFSRLLRTMEFNEDGIRRDIDTEFVHDFRVAVRRTRAGLGQIKGVFDDATRNEFKERFAVLGRASNRLRDLDVYLLSEGHYRRLLPEGLRAGLQPLFASLTDERNAAHEAFARFLDGDDYARLKTRWHRALGGSAGKGGRADRPAVDMATRFIRRRHAAVLRDGRAIGHDTPDAALHALRIDCKKLRYLLEFFRSLFPGEGVPDLVRILKRLQDVLGEFNDLHVQQQELRERLGRCSGPEEAAALGGLLAVLHSRQREVRRQFADRFRSFDEEDAPVFRAVFGAAEAGS